MIDFTEKLRPPLPGVWMLAPSHAQGALYSAYNRERTSYRAASMRAPAPPRDGKQIAIIPIRGLITQYDRNVGTPTAQIADEFDQALTASSIEYIVLDIDSYGGGIEGVPELADKIYQARKLKTVVAVANSWAGSAACWLGSAATLMFCTQSGAVGGLGCVMLHVDESKAIEKEGLAVTLVHRGKYKVDGNSFQPLSDSGLEHMQSIVDEYHGWMVKDIAKHRSVTTDKVRRDYGEGRMLLAKEAHAAGMVDGIASFQQVLQMIANVERKQQNHARSEAWRTKNRIAEVRKPLDDISRN